MESGPRRRPPTQVKPNFCNDINEDWLSKSSGKSQLKADFGGTSLARPPRQRAAVAEPSRERVVQPSVGVTGYVVQHFGY
jgi:hypothetical protein